MSMEYIRKTYGVPAKRGARIEFTDTRGRIHEGRIVGSRGMYLRADMPTIRGGTVTMHPTSDVSYLPEPTTTRRKRGKACYGCPHIWGNSNCRCCIVWINAHRPNEKVRLDLQDGGSK